MNKNIFIAILFLFCVVPCAWSEMVDVKTDSQGGAHILRGDIEALNKKYSDINNTVAEQNRNIHALQDRIQSSESEIQETNRSLEKLSSEINRLNNEIKNAVEVQRMNADNLQTHLEVFEKNVRQNKVFLDQQSSENRRLNTEIANLRASISKQSDVINGLKQTFEANQKNADLAMKSIKHDTSSKIQNINQSISQRTIYWIIAAVTLLLFTIATFLIMKKKLASNTNLLDRQIIKTRETLEAEAIKLDSKLIELFEKQLDVSKQTPMDHDSKKDETDHTLPLQVGQEIHRMRTRIANMPEDTKGIGALGNSLNRLEEQFNDNGDELIDLIGKPFVDGLNINANFVPSDDLNPGEQIITKVIKPQINFNGVLIQAAQVEVSTGD